MPLPTDWIVPAWAAPPTVRALFTTRVGGVPSAAFDGVAGMNLGTGADGDARAVAANRAILAGVTPTPPRWLRQVHGTGVLAADTLSARAADPAAAAQAPAADASFTLEPGVVLAVLVADCMPVLLADRRGRGVAVAHAGWRGLAGGIVQATVAALRQALREPAADLVAWLGPCIGPTRFVVGDDVRSAMAASLPAAHHAFAPHAPGKWLADLPALGRQALAQAGVTCVAGGTWCTVDDPARFYSYRRDRVTGRHAALVWLAPSPVAA